MKRFNIIGIGIRDFKQLTVEALELIPTLNQVHHTTLFHDELSNLNNNTISHVSRYIKASSFDVYSEIESDIIHSIEQFESVGFVTYGHPLFLVNISQSLIKYCKSNMIEVNIVPGISSLDAIWCLQKNDPGYPGFQVIDAEILIKKAVIINTGLDLYLPHITEAFIPFDRKARVSDYPSGIQIVKRYLLKYYSQEHIVTFFAYSPLTEIPDFELSIKLDELDHDWVLEKLFKGTTLVVMHNNDK